MGAVVRSEAEISKVLETMAVWAGGDKWSAAWAEALEWVLS